MAEDNITPLEDETTPAPETTQKMKFISYENLYQYNSLLKEKVLKNKAAKVHKHAIADVTGLSDAIQGIQEALTNTVLTLEDTTSGNAITGVAVDGHKITVTKGSFVESTEKTGVTFAADGTDGEKVATVAAVKAHVTDTIKHIANAMVFKGVVSTGAYPESPIVGDTWKVIKEDIKVTEGEGESAVAVVKAKIGDTIVYCQDKDEEENDIFFWTTIPSGDEPSGTVTGVIAGEGLVATTAEGVELADGTIVESGKLSLAEVTGLTFEENATTTAAGSVVAIESATEAESAVVGATFKVPRVTVDKYGRVTGLTESSFTIEAITMEDLNAMLDDIFGVEESETPEESTEEETEPTA